MAHTTRVVNLGNTAIAQITITNYVVGGESFTLGEFNLTGSITGVSILQNLMSSTDIVPVVSGNFLLLKHSCNNAEIPTTNGINFSFLVIVIGT